MKRKNKKSPEMPKKPVTMYWEKPDFEEDTPSPDIYYTLPNQNKKLNPEHN